MGQGLAERLKALQASSATVVLERCDAGEEDQVCDMLARVRKQFGPLRGVMHTAGITADSHLASQNAESIRKVCMSKAGGAQYLHYHTEDDPLELFVMYSSISALIGNAGQANYSAANVYLDELVRWRVSKGLAGLSVHWPAVAGVGMAAAMSKTVKISSAMSIQPDTVKHVLKQLLLAVHLREPVQSVLPRTMLEGNSIQGMGVLLARESSTSRNPQDRNTAAKKANPGAKTRQKYANNNPKTTKMLVLAQVSKLVAALAGSDVDIHAPLMEAEAGLGYSENQGCAIKIMAIGAL